MSDDIYEAKWKLLRDDYDAKWKPRIEVDRLKAENERLRRDAERYRWICKFPGDAEYAIAHALNGCDGTGYGPTFRDLLSDAIDAALLATKESV